MSDKMKNLLEKAMALDDEERAELAEILIGSLDASYTPSAEIDAAWKVELERRWQAYQRGEMDAVPIEEIFEMLRTDQE